MGVTFWRSRAEHPLAAHAAQGRPDIAAFIDECQARQRRPRPTSRRWRRRACATGLCGHAPADRRRRSVWVGNYVLMGYGDGAVMGVPAHDERDFAFAKKYGLPIQQVIAVPGETFSLDALAGVVRGQGARRLRQLGQVRRPRLRGGGRRDRRRPEREGPRRKAGAVPAARLGHLAPALLGHADPDHPLRACGAVPVPEKDLPVVLPEDCVPDGSGNPLAKCDRFPEVHLPEVRQAGAARDRHDGHLRRLVLVLHALLLAGRADDGRRAQRLLDADGPVHRRHRARGAAPAVRALLDQGDARHGPGAVRRAVQAAASRRACCSTTCYFREDAAGGSAGSPGRDRHRCTTTRAGAERRRVEDGQPVDFGGVGRCRRARTTSSSRATSSTKFGADTARAFVMFAGPPDQSAAWRSIPAPKARTASCAGCGTSAPSARQR